MVKQIRVSNANMMTFSEKLSRFSWGLFIPMCMVLVISILVLYSAGGGHWRPYALSQLMKIIISFGVFFFEGFVFFPKIRQGQLFAAFRVFDDRFIHFCLHRWRFSWSGWRPYHPRLQ